MGDKKFGDSYLKQNGINAHEVKKDYGCNPVSRYDIYNGDTVTIKDKNGITYEDTDMSKDEFFETYGHSKNNDRRY